MNFIEDKKADIDENEDIELLDDFFFINENRPERIVETIISLCSGRLKKYGDFDFLNNIQIITPTKKGMVGTKELNKILQEKLNGYDEGKNEKSFGEVTFRENDRVMQVKNNYNMIWEKDSDNKFGKDLGNGVFNGELGIIERINPVEKNVRVKFDDGKTAIYENADLDQLEHAYAITVHKAQGSEFDVVILPICQLAPMLQTRNLIYTAITRAKKMLIVIGNKNIVDYMIANNNTKNRNTGLKYKMEKIL